MGYSSYLVYTTVSDMIPLLVTGALYILHIALLNSWGFFFFHLRRVDLALNALLALDVLASWLLISVSTIMPFAAVLCLPYFCWLLELTYLNMYMYRNNDQADILGFTKEDVIAAHEEPLREMAPLREAVVPQREKFD